MVVSVNGVLRIRWKLLSEEIGVICGDTEKELFDSYIQQFIDITASEAFNYEDSILVYAHIPDAYTMHRPTAVISILNKAGKIFESAMAGFQFVHRKKEFEDLILSLEEYAWHCGRKQRNITP